MSAPGANNGDNGADLHVGEQPLGIGDTNANAAMRGRRHSERGWERDFPGFRDFVGNAVKADVAALATFRETGHEAHAFIGVGRVKSLCRFGKYFEGARGGGVEEAG